jgi:hypothetical protein
MSTRHADISPGTYDGTAGLKIPMGAMNRAMNRSLSTTPPPRRTARPEGHAAATVIPAGRQQQQQRH